MQYDRVIIIHAPYNNAGTTTFRRRQGGMLSNLRESNVDWAFVLAPSSEGWRVKFVPGGARLTAAGGVVQSLADASSLIHSLLPLLREDRTTADLLRAMGGESRYGGPAPGPAQDRDLLQTVWEACADAMVLSDRDGTVLHANPAYSRLYGYAPDEVIGHSFSIIFPPEVREWAVEGYRTTFDQPDIVPAVVSSVRRADGTERVVETHYDFVVREGTRVAMLSTIRDVTERAEMERVSQLRAEMLQAVLLYFSSSLVR